MTAKEVIKKLIAAGWYQVRQTGSHKIFKYKENPATIVVPEHGKKI